MYCIKKIANNYANYYFCPTYLNIMGHYNINQFSKITGITKFVLRTWENRYGYLKAERTKTNIRIYSDKMLIRALNTNYLIEHSYKISKIAKMSDSEIKKLVFEVTKKSEGENEKYYINELISSALNFDSKKFNSIYDEGMSNLGLIPFYEKVLIKTLQKIGFLWLSKQFSPSQEHFLSEHIKQKIAAETNNIDLHSNKDTWLLFLPENEFHEIGLLFAKLLLIKYKFNVIYLGSNVPLDSLYEVGQKVTINKTLFFSIANLSQEKIKSTIKCLNVSFQNASHFGIINNINNLNEEEFTVLNNLNDFIGIIKDI